MEGIRAVLKPGGAFIIEYANKQNARAILRYWLRHQEWSPFDPKSIEFAKLNFNLHPKTMREWLTEARFLIRQQRTVSHFRLNLLKRLLPSALLAAADAALQTTGKFWQLTPCVFLRADADSSGIIAAPDTFFRCTICGHNGLDEKDEYMACPQCSNVWMIRDGIYDFGETLQESK